MKEQILKLRSEGKSYREIVKLLGCSKGTISYHCGNNQKIKEKQAIYKTTQKSVINKKIDSFIGRNKTGIIVHVKRSAINKLFYNKIVNNPFCYLTGRKIDLSDGESYCLDHIIPYYVSENNSIDNMAIVCKEANYSKTYLELQQYLDLCKEVLENQGYSIKKL